MPKQYVAPSKPSLLNDLVKQFTSTLECSDAQRQSHNSYLLSYAVRLLGSSISSTVYDDEHTALLNLNQLLEQCGRPEDATRLAALHAALAKNFTFNGQQRWAMLHMLYQIRKDELSRHRMGSVPMRMTTSLSQSVSNGGLTALVRPSGTGSAALSTGASRRQASSYLAAPSLEPRATSPGLSKRWDSSARDASLRQPNSLQEANPLSAVSEPLLVRDVLYACQGINGKFIQYHRGVPGSPDGGGGYVFEQGVQVAAAERMLALRLCELGWLFRKVRTYAADSQRLERQGCVRQAFSGALQHELAEYFRLMAVLHAQSQQPIPTAPDNGVDTADGGAPYLTLRRLAVWLCEPTRRMRLLAALADGSASLSGGPLAGAVWAHAQTGDPGAAAYLRRLLARVAAPLVELVVAWVAKGELRDPHGEFFISSNVLSVGSGPGSVPQGQEAAALWQHGFSIQRLRLPPFIGEELAQRVLRAGKTLNFLREYCGDAAWVQAQAPLLQGAAGTATPPHAAAGEDMVERIERLVSAAAALVDRRLLDVLHGPLGFAQHCTAIRSYLLLGQGDFVQALMDLLQIELDKDARHVTELQLNHVLRLAVSASNAKYDEEEVLERLRVRKQQHAPSGAEKGWDVFSLQYDVSGPLCVLFSAGAMAKYARVSSLMWRLKRAEHALATAWHTLKCEVERKMRKMGKAAMAVAHVERECLRVRSSMSHFCTNFQYYITFEVLEGAWESFQREWAVVGDLDELVGAHERYLDTLLGKALLDVSADNLQRTLAALLSNMLRLNTAVRRFNTTVMAGEARLDKWRRQVAQRTAAGQWGSSGVEEECDEVIAPGELNAVLHEVEQLDAEHQRLIQHFTNALPEKAHDEVRFLLYRLDFTEYYQRRRSTVDSMEDDFY